jgi:hypothetical protein
VTAIFQCQENDNVSLNKCEKPTEEN